MAPAIRNDTRALVAVVALLTMTGLLLVNQNMWVTVPIAAFACILLLGIGRRAGLSWRELGVGRAELASGARWGIAAALVVVVGYLVVILLPIGRSALNDEAVPTTAVAVVVKVLMVIPIRTILLEEIAFRGVLWGLLRRRGSAMSATCWSAVAFGLWHIPAGLRAIDSNEALEGLVDGSRLMAGAVVAAIVVLTALAGLIFGELRRRSRSLLAPMGLHWATNGLGTLVSAIAPKQ
jgi:membrane protease YdiL (CAAX protease family)